jgi:GTPase
MSGLIAIVGRPNVGKSALFNRIAGRRIAIVHDEPGVTRDRISAEAEWQGRSFTLVDTGGIGLLRREKSEDVITRAALDQAALALEAAHVIIMVTNVQEGVAPLDGEVAARLRQSGKTVLVAVNKVDHTGLEAQAAEFAELGFESIFPVSAIHGAGIRELMDEAVKVLPTSLPASDQETGTPAPAAALKLAIVGRPNVGKSSLVNALTQSSRVIVSPIPGTTRDSVDVPFEVDADGVRQSYILIDTAGIRKTRQVSGDIEFYSVKRAEDSIARCDIAVLVLDAESGILEQDKKIAGRIVEAGKACVVVVNKWDLVADAVRKVQIEEMALRKDKERPRQKRLITLSEFGEWVQELLFFLDYAPVIFTSAKSGFHMERLLEAVRYVADQLRQQIPTALLNRVLREALERQSAIGERGQFLKFFYATQVRQAPPTFLLFLNRDEALAEPCRKYLQREMRRAFGYEGCPIHLVAKGRPKPVESVRTRQQNQRRTQKSGPRRRGPLRNR